MKTPPLLTTSVIAVALASGFSGCLFAQTGAPAEPRTPDVIFVPTPQPVVDAMLKLANVQPGEMVYDLGCGDGRAVITAARDFGARGIGVDIDPERIEESNANAKSAGVTERVEFKQADLFQMKFSDADVLFLYLLPKLNVQLRPRILDDLRPGSRVVSHAFSMAEWEADQRMEVDGKTIFFWIVPAKVAGNWTLSLPGGDRGVLSLKQEFQTVSGTLKAKEKTLPIADARLKGSTLTFTFGAGPDAGRVSAEITGNRLEGTVQRGSDAQPESWVGQLSQ
jgi:SAM-dependent methyltransferase